MKIFKSFLIMAMVAVAGLFASCSEDGCWDAYDTTSEKTYSFEQAESNYSLTPSDTIRQIAVKVFRSNAKGNDTIPVAVTVNSDLLACNVTDAVVFENGKDFAEILIDVDFDNLVIGNKYTASFAFVVDSVNFFEHNYSISGNKTAKVSLQLQYTWRAAGKALYTEGLMNTFFTIQDLTYPVDVEQANENPAIIRLVDPYGKAYPYNEPGDYDTKKVHYMVFNCTDPEGVYMDGYHASGMDWGYGEFTFGCLAYYYMTKGKTFEEVKAAGFMGTLDEDLCITFPAESMLISMADYNGGGLYTSNINGTFKVDLSSADLVME